MAFHLRRRLNAEEHRRVGQAIDLRALNPENVKECQRRYDAMKRYLPPEFLRMVIEEAPAAVL